MDPYERARQYELDQKAQRRADRAKAQKKYSRQKAEEEARARYDRMSPAEKEAYDQRKKDEFYNDPVIKSVIFLGKNIYKIGKGTVEAGKIAGTTLHNAYKINSGSIEVVDNDIENKTHKKIENTESNNTTVSNSSSIVTTTTKLGKGAIEVGKTTAVTLRNAYKITTGNTEIVNTDENGKTQIVIKKSQPVASNNNFNITTIPAIANSITSKTIELSSKPGVKVNLQEDTIKTYLTFKLNNKYTVTLTEFRSVNILDNIKSSESLNFQFVFSNLDGSRMSINDPAYLEVEYDDGGKLIKLSLPNPPVPSNNPLYPVLTIYHGNLYTLPVNSGYYNYLVHKVYENGGFVEINHVDPAYSLECLG